MNKGDKEFDLSELIGGTLSIFGLKLDLGELLSSPENVRGKLEELREKLKKVGGRETLSDEEWGREAIISGHLRTRGIFGEREYHIGTAGPSTRPRGGAKASEPLQAVEPAVDVFHEPEEVVVVAEVPGVEMADLQLKVQDDVLSLSTGSTARWAYRKEVKLGSSVEADSLKATCRNGILEIHLRKKTL